MYPDVYAWLVLLMPDYASSFSPGSLASGSVPAVAGNYDLLIRGEYRDATSPYGVDATALSSDDQDRLNEAVALRVACRVVSGVTTGAVGLLSSDGDGESARSFTGMQDQVEGWMARADMLLNRPSFGGVLGVHGPLVVDAYPTRPCYGLYGPFGGAIWP